MTYLLFKPIEYAILSFLQMFPYFFFCLKVIRLGFLSSLLACVHLQVFVCCVTKRYCQSDACQREATLACNLKKPIIPLLFEDMSWPPEGQLALIFTTLIYIKMSVEHGEFPDAQFQEMMRKVGEFVQT